MTTGLKSLLIAGLLANAALMAQAQTTTPPTAPKPMAGASSPRMQTDGMRHERGMHGHLDPAKREAMVAGHLAELKTKLAITAAQESSWTAFGTAMQPAARMAPAHPDRAEAALIKLIPTRVHEDVHHA